MSFASMLSSLFGRRGTATAAPMRTAPMKIKTKVAGAVAGAVALATVVIGGYEGYVNHVYKDPVGVSTYCYGETQNPTAGKIYTRQECQAQLSKRVVQFNAGVKKCVKVALPVKTEAAFTSLAYNIGIGGFCNSTVVRRANAGNLRGACDAMLMWDKAGWRTLRGLTVRRGGERALCLEGLTEGR